MVYKSLCRTGQTTNRLQCFANCGQACSVDRREIPGKGWEYRIAGGCCGDRLCTICANKRSARLRLALIPRLEQANVAFITLTLAGLPRESLPAKIDRLYKSFRALRLMPLWKKSVKGGVAFLEIKHNAKSNRWHPHLHILADSSFMPHAELSQLWYAITGDTFIVDIRRIDSKDQVAGYVTKYASKPLNMSFANDPDLLDEAVIALKGRRLALAFGSFYGTPLDLEPEEMCNEGEEGLPDWDHFMPLNTLLEQCNAGDTSSMDILRQCAGESRWRASLESSP